MMTRKNAQEYLTVKKRHKPQLAWPVVFELLVCNPDASVQTEESKYSFQGGGGG